MNDLFQSAVARDDFQRWLDLGTAPFAIWQGDKLLTTLSRLEKRPSVDYLYSVPAAKDNSISWNNNPQFCGVYDMRNNGQPPSAGLEVAPIFGYLLSKKGYTQCSDG